MSENLMENLEISPRMVTEPNVSNPPLASGFEAPIGGLNSDKLNKKNNLIDNSSEKSEQSAKQRVRRSSWNGSIPDGKSHQHSNNDDEKSFREHSKNINANDKTSQRQDERSSRRIQKHENLPPLHNKASPRRDSHSNAGRMAQSSTVPQLPDISNNSPRKTNNHSNSSTPRSARVVSPVKPIKVSASDAALSSNVTEDTSLNHESPDHDSTSKTSHLKAEKSTTPPAIDTTRLPFTVDDDGYQMSVLKSESHDSVDSTVTTTEDATYTVDQQTGDLHISPKTSTQHETEFKCSLCNLFFATQLLCDEHVTHSAAHKQAIADQNRRIAEAIKKTRKLEELALQAVNRFKAILDASKKKALVSEFSSQQAHSAFEDNSDLSVNQIRWKKAISDVMSKKLLAQYQLLNQELSSVQLFNTKYIKLLYNNNKLFWKIKSRFLYLIYLHLNMNTIELIILLLPSHDIMFHKDATTTDHNDKSNNAVSGNFGATGGSSGTGSTHNKIKASPKSVSHHSSHSNHSNHSNHSAIGVNNNNSSRSSHSAHSAHSVPNGLRTDRAKSIAHKSNINSSNSSRKNSKTGPQPAAPVTSAAVVSDDGPQGTTSEPASADDNADTTAVDTVQQHSTLPTAAGAGTTTADSPKPSKAPSKQKSSGPRTIQECDYSDTDSDVESDKYRVKRIYIKHNVLLDLCFGVRGGVSALLSDCITYDHPSMDISLDDTKRNADPNHTVIYERDPNNVLTENQKYESNNSDVNKHTQKQVNVNTTVENTLVTYILDHIALNPRRLDAKKKHNAIDCLSFDATNMKYSPLYLEAPEGCVPVPIQADSIYAQWDVKIKIERMSEGKSFHIDTNELYLPSSNSDANKGNNDLEGDCASASGGNKTNQSAINRRDKDRRWSYVG